MKITGSGALNLDIIYQVPDLKGLRVAGIDLKPGRETWGSHEQAQTLLAELETRGRLLTRSGGGSAANTVCALAAMGFHCHFIGSTGSGEAGSFILESMKGVDCSLVARQGRSSLCIIVMAENSRDRSMFVAPSPVRLDFSSRRLEDTLAGTDLFHMTSLIQDNGPDLQHRLISMTGRQALVSFDPGEIYAARGYDHIKRLLGETDILFSTDYEMRQIFGQADEDRIIANMLGKHCTAADKYNFFRELSTPVIAKKMGSRGAALYAAGSSFFQSAMKVREVVDNTGAGDAFNAGLISAILRGMSSREALHEAIRLAGMSLAYPGRSWINFL